MDDNTRIVQAAVRVLAAMLDKQSPPSSDLAILQDFLGAACESDPGLLVIVAIFKALERREKVRTATA